MSIMTPALNGLRTSPLLFVFYEAVDIPSQRRLFEDCFGMTIVENRFHPPHHRHGLVKYDAGPLLLSLNQASADSHSETHSDALTAAIVVPRNMTDVSQLATCSAGRSGRKCWTDAAGHHFEVTVNDDCDTGYVTEVRLAVSNLANSLYFYRDVLGIEFVPTDDDTLLFATPSVRIRLECRHIAADDRQLRYDSYLLVLYAHPIQTVFEALCERGVEFTCSRPTFSTIGGTARFRDPSGQTFCLYDPSDESLAWESGERVRSVIGAFHPTCF